MLVCSIQRNNTSWLDRLAAGVGVQSGLADRRTQQGTACQSARWCRMP